MEEFNMEYFNSKRNAQGIMRFALFFMVLNIGVNFLYFKDLNELSDVKSMNIFTSIGMMAVILFNISNKGITVSKEERREINIKMIPIVLLGLPFIVYLFFSIIVVKEVQIVISSLIMIILFINICLIKDKIFRMKSDLTETQKNWRRANNNYRGIKQSNILWRIKPMLTPRVSVNIKERLKNVDWIYLIFDLIILADLGIEIKSIIFLIIISIPGIKDVIYIFDLILGTYSETEGECTEVIRKSYSRSRRDYHKVVVTDYENERELTFTVEGYAHYKEGEIIKVLHGGLSKKVIGHYTFRKSF